MHTTTLLLGGKTVLWYNGVFKQELMCAHDYVLQPVSRVLPGLEVHTCREAGGQVLECQGRRWRGYASSVKRSEELTIVWLVPERRGGGVPRHPPGGDDLSGGRLRLFDGEPEGIPAGAPA